MESVFGEIGTCGCFQIMQTICLQLIRLVCACGICLMVYGNYEPDWYCVKNDTLPDAVSVNGSATILNMQGGRNLKEPDDTVVSRAISLHQNVSNSIAFRANYTTIAYHIGTCDQLPTCQRILFDPTSLTLVSEFGLICDQAYIPSIIIAINMMGIVIGSNIGGQIGEIFGRKTCIYASLALASLTMIASGFSTSWQMYAGFSFFIGLGLGGIITSCMVYTLEFMTAKWRGYFNAIPVWGLCVVVFACIVTALKNWQYIHFFCGALGMAFLLFGLWTPDSLRWLYVHGRDEDTKKVLQKIMKFNGRRRNVDEVFENMKQIDDGTNFKRKFTYLDLFRTRQLRVLTIKGSIIYCLSVMAYFTLGFSVKSFSGDYYANLFISFASETPFLFLLGTCVNKVGRKWTMAVFMWLATLLIILCVIVHYVMNEEVADSIIKYLAFLSKGCLSLIWTGMVLFTVELYPTEVRTLAQGFLNTVARLGGVVSSSLIPRDRESSAICFIVLSGALLIMSVIILTFPETKNKPLVDKIEARVPKRPKQEAAVLT